MQEGSSAGVNLTCEQLRGLCKAVGTEAKGTQKIGYLLALVQHIFDISDVKEVMKACDGSRQVYEDPVLAAAGEHVLDCRGLVYVAVGKWARKERGVDICVYEYL